jgi:hypothetical protein
MGMPLSGCTLHSLGTSTVPRYQAVDWADWANWVDWVDCPCGLPVWTACLGGRGGGPAANSGWARGVRNHNVDVQRRRNCKPRFAVGGGGCGPSPSFVGQHAAAHSRRQTADGRQLGTCLLLLVTEALQPTRIRQPATGSATLQRAPSPTANCQL